MGTSVPWGIRARLETVLVVATGGSYLNGAGGGQGAAEHCTVQGWPTRDPQCGERVSLLQMP